MVDRVKAHWAADIQRVGKYRNQLEHDVAQALLRRGLDHEYEKDRLEYVTHHRYIPDFRVGDVYIEVKGYWPSADRKKLVHVVQSHPGIKLFVALERWNSRINRGSKTTYGQWCTKHALPWCPLPIPLEFLTRWLNGERVSY